MEVVDEDNMDICFCLDGGSAFDRNREKRRMVAVSAVFTFWEGFRNERGACYDG